MKAIILFLLIAYCQSVFAGRGIASNEETAIEAEVLVPDFNFRCKISEMDNKVQVTAEASDKVICVNRFNPLNTFLDSNIKKVLASQNKGVQCTIHTNKIADTRCGIELYKSSYDISGKALCISKENDIESSVCSSIEYCKKSILRYKKTIDPFSSTDFSYLIIRNNINFVNDNEILVDSSMNSFEKWYTPYSNYEKSVTEALDKFSNYIGCSSAE